ncbi:MAG: sortase [Thermomicrobiales bacterium]|nr:sortase [Thermomicrobiales bacterium]
MSQPRAAAIIRIVAVLLIGAGVILLTAALRSTTHETAEIARERARFEAIGAFQPPATAVSGESRPSPTTTPTASSPAPTGADLVISAQIGPEQGDLSASDPTTPVRTPTPPVDMPPPTHITIAAVGIDTDIVEVEPKTDSVDGQLVETWSVADWAAGHHVGSADPGENGNIVLAGHDDVRGEVFRGLHDIELGAEVLLTTPDGVYRYVVEEIHVRLERGAPLSERLATGVFIAPMPEERLTLITCWPYGVDDHRIIVVAKPAD